MVSQLERLQIKKMIDSLCLDCNKNPKDQIIQFLDQLKELGPSNKYSLERESHLAYITYLLGIEECLQQKNFEKVVYFLRYHIIEQPGLVRQSRFYVNLIHILENFERNEIDD